MLNGSFAPSLIWASDTFNDTSSEPLTWISDIILPHLCQNLWLESQTYLMTPFIGVQMLIKKYLWRTLKVRGKGMRSLKTSWKVGICRVSLGVQRWSLTRVWLRRIHFHSLFSSNPPQFTPKREKLHKTLFSNALGSRKAYSQEHLRNSNLFDPSKGIRIAESKTFCLRNPVSAKFLLVESRIEGFGIWNTAQGIWNPLTIGIWNPSFMDIESGIHGVESSTGRILF